MDSAIAALDSMRRHALGTVLRVRPLRAVFVAPRLRVPAMAMVGLLVSAVFALRAPLVALWLGAALFGVPHVIAGVRHVAVKRAITPLTRALVAVAGFVGVMQIALPDGAPWALRAFVVLFASAVVVEIATARAPLSRTAPMIAATLAVAAIGFASPTLALLALAHLHAVSSIAYATVVARRRGVSLTPVVVVAAAIGALAAMGGLDAFMPTSLVAPRSAATSIALEATGAALNRLGPLAFRRALFLYAFGQSLHFAMWLRVVPEVDRPSPVPWTWRRALQALRADFGRLALPLVAIGALSIPMILLGGGIARETYFALTYFHFGLEAAALARIVVRPA